MPTIDVNDTSLFYELSGEGPAILFVHGMCGHADVWADQAARLSAEGYTCVRYDRRGHTRSTRGTAPISDALYADDAAALIEALGLGPCLLVGSSSGARIGVDVALRHGHLLRGAVYSEPPLFSLDRDAGRSLLADLVPRLDEAVTTGGPRAAIDAFFEQVCPHMWSMIDAPAKDRLRANAEIGLTDLQSPSLDVEPNDLAAITIPTLVIAGSQSNPAFRSIAQRLTATLPDARYLDIEGSGHVAYTERPDEFFTAVAAFAAEVDRNVSAGQ